MVVRKFEEITPVIVALAWPGLVPELEEHVCDRKAGWNFTNRRPSVRNGRAVSGPERPAGAWAAIGGGVGKDEPPRSVIILLLL